MAMTGHTAERRLAARRRPADGGTAFHALRAVLPAAECDVSGSRGRLDYLAGGEYRVCLPGAIDGRRHTRPGRGGRTAPLCLRDHVAASRPGRRRDARRVEESWAEDRADQQLWPGCSTPLARLSPCVAIRRDRLLLSGRHAEARSEDSG